MPGAIAIGICILYHLIRNNSSFKSPSFEKIIVLSGKNQNQLSEFFEKYSVKLEDSERLKSAQFIICGLSGLVNYDSNHLSKFDTVLKLSQRFVKSLEATGQPWWNHLNFQYYDSMTSVVKKWEQENGIYGRGEYKPDLENITADYLIRNTELAFAAREKYPWTRQLSFDDFCEYVLPHAWGSGPLDNWRAKLNSRFDSVAQKHIAEGGEFQMKNTVNEILGSMGQLYFTMSLNPYIGYLD